MARGSPKAEPSTPGAPAPTLPWNCAVAPARWHRRHRCDVAHDRRVTQRSGLHARPGFDPACRLRPDILRLPRNATGSQPGELLGPFLRDVGLAAEPARGAIAPGGNAALSHTARGVAGRRKAERLAAGIGAAQHRREHILVRLAAPERLRRVVPARAWAGVGFKLPRQRCPAPLRG
jgi:hypothetical protein